MAWIVGKLGANLDAAEVARLGALHPAARQRVVTDRLYVAAGGLAETCHAGTRPDGGGWAAVGTALARSGDAVSLLETAGWHALLAAPSPDLGGLDGSFAAVRWDGDGTLTACVDPVGVRSFYVARTGDGVVFSTRLDWVCRLVGRGDVDFDQLGAHWLAFSQLAPRSLAAGVERLVQGATARCTAGAVAVRGTPWHPGTPDDATRAAAPDLPARLAPFLHPRLAAPRRLSLGLSGGLDSRLLLALLLDHGRPPHLHLFGALDEPDVVVSKAIAAAEGLPQVHLVPDVPPADTCLALLWDYAGQTCATTRASAVAKLGVYGTLHAQHRVVVDGGFGEVARRHFFNRILNAVLLRGGRDPARVGPVALLPYLRVHRADVFTHDVGLQMTRGLAGALADVLAAMPPTAEVGGAANYLDLLAIRTWLPNFYGYGQAWLDHQVAAYMPFAQQSVLKGVLHSPLRYRSGGGYVRRVIRQRAPALAAYPLAKGGTTHPFRLTTVPAWAWMKAKTRLGPTYGDRLPGVFLHTVGDAVRDLVRSEETRSYAAYDYPKVLALVERYYGGETALAAELDWWLAFESWRRTLVGKSIV